MPSSSGGGGGYLETTANFVWAAGGDHKTYNVCMYVYIYSPDMDIQKYTVTMKIIVNSVKISSPIGTISNSEVVDLQ